MTKAEIYEGYSERRRKSGENSLYPQPADAPVGGSKNKKAVR
jgi:hypothetical protein